MAEDFERLVKKYNVYYEVSPYHALVEERHGSPTATRSIMQVGFDVDVYGLSNKSELELPPSAEYALGYTELKKIADAVSHHASECLIEVISFATSFFSEASSHFQPEALVRIRISHLGSDQAVGPAEQHALEEVEKQLRSLGIRRK